MNLNALQCAFRDLGVTRAYVKHLAPNDNSKNQIFLGRDFSSLNLLPFGQIVADARGSRRRPAFKASLDFHWLARSGALSPARAAQLILYPQYPEVRLSGFLRGCPSSPKELLASRATGRVLVLGITGANRVIAFAASGRAALASEVPRPPARRQGVLVPLGLGTAEPSDDRETLLRALRRIHSAGWIDAKRLDPGGQVLPCPARNCGGFTLEAELGIRPNSQAEPDFAGWEVKQVGVKSFERLSGALTLMTPEPDGGFYKTGRIEAFVRRFGYPDRRGRSDRINFGGRHFASRRCNRTGLTLEVEGFDPAKGTITRLDGGLCLVSDTGEIAAKWSFAKLMKHWNQKHARAAYVMSKRRDAPRRQYAYGPVLRLGTGTDFVKFLSAVADGSIYYDPGIKLAAASSATPETKRRSQFRIPATRLERLYRTFDVVRLD